MTLSGSNFTYYLRNGDKEQAMIIWTEMKQSIDIINNTLVQMANDFSGATCQ